MMVAMPPLMKEPFRLFTSAILGIIMIFAEKKLLIVGVLLKTPG